ncbi:MAG: hypothetical protein H7Z76_06170 [Methylotenera sp.]|nr:hypothetical protein [Flavobacterium sp.]
MRNHFYTLMFSLILIQSCQRKINSNKFIGTWNGTHTEGGYAKLKINKENTFSYESGGNGNKTFSSGHYKIVGDSIALTSKNATEVDGCYIIIQYGQCFFKDLRQTQMNCQPSKNEFYEFFDNDIFYFKKNTLIHKDNPEEEEKCPDKSEDGFVKSK